MLSKGWHLTCLGVGALVVSMSQARADDTTIRMGGKGSIQDAGANLSRLDLRPQDNDDDDIVPVWHRYKYGYGRSFYGGGFSGGFYRGYPGFYSGYRSFYSYPRYSFGFSYYQPRYYGGFGYNNFYGGYNSFYGGYRSFYVSPFYYGGFGFINGSIQIDQPQPSTLQLKPINPVTPMNPNLGDPVLPNPRLPVPQNPNDGFRYDGGPANPVPLPQGSPEPKAEPNPQLGIPDRSVSLPTKPTTPVKKYQYAAYGEKPKAETAPAKVDDTLFVKTTKK
jgi:hypothetical protein